jgi:hypothetical protein
MPPSQPAQAPKLDFFTSLRLWFCIVLRTESIMWLGVHVFFACVRGNERTNDWDREPEWETGKPETELCVVIMFSPRSDATAFFICVSSVISRNHEF